MTKPNLDEKLTELSAKYQTDKPDFCGVDLGQHEAFMAGAQAALEALRGVPGEFDSDACDRALEAKGYTETNSFFAGRYAARWQFSRDKERIAASEGAVQIAAEILTKKHAKFEKAQARIAELTEAIVFSLRGLQMWRTYQSPGNIAEVEQRLRQALKRDGGSSD